MAGVGAEATGPARHPNSSSFLQQGAAYPFHSPQSEEQAQDPHGELSRFSLLPWNCIDCTQLRLWAQRYHRNNLSQRPSSRLTRHAHPRGGWQGPGLFFVSILKGFKRKVHLELLATPKPASQERPTLPEGRGWGCWLLFCKKLYTSFMHQLGAGWQVTSTR